MAATASSLIAGISMCGFSSFCQSKALACLILPAPSRAGKGTETEMVRDLLSRKEKEPEVLTRVLVSSYCKGQKRVQYALKPPLESTTWWRSWSPSLASPASQVCSRSPVLAQVLHTHHWCFMALEQLPVFLTSTCVCLCCVEGVFSALWCGRWGAHSSVFMYYSLACYCFLGICLDAWRGGDTALVWVCSQFPVHLPIPTKDKLGLMPIKIDATLGPSLKTLLWRQDVWLKLVGLTLFSCSYGTV